MADIKNIKNYLEILRIFYFMFYDNVFSLFSQCIVSIYYADGVLDKARNTHTYNASSSKINVVLTKFILYRELFTTRTKFQNSF